MATLAKISNLDEENSVLKFTISNVNVSVINAIRRTLLSDIKCIVFKTQPYSENKVDIKINKTRLNNELLKQRISCIPIHISDIYNFPYNEYIVELDKKNETNNIIYATTEDFKIKNINTNKYLEEAEIRKIFPPDPITGDYINIVRLRPKLTDNSDTEHIKLEAHLSISDANDDGMFNVVSTCAYGNTLDAVKIKEKWTEKEEELKQKNLKKEEIEFAKKDWMILDAKRLFIENSFDFTLETIGIYSNFNLMDLAASVIIKKLYMALETLKTNIDLIKDASDTMDNCYEIILKDEDYTIGKILEYCLYSKYFAEKKELSYVGFLKKHPHDKDSIIKLSFKNIISKDDILIVLEDCVNNSIIILNSIKEYFSEK